jgi:hypothetical protein
MIPISSLMAVDLTSDDESALAVTSLDSAHREQPTVQAAGRPFAEWQWKISANEPGTWRLRLHGYVVIDQQKIKVREVDFLTRVDDVQVNFDLAVAVGRFFATYWQWLWTALLVPVAAVGWRCFRSWRDKPPTPPAPPKSRGRPPHSNPQRTAPRRPPGTRRQPSTPRQP